MMKNSIFCLVISAQIMENIAKVKFINTSKGFEFKREESEWKQMR